MKSSWLSNHAGFCWGIKNGWKANELMMSMLTAKSQTGLTQRLVGALAILLLFQFYLYWKHLAQLSDSRTSLDAEVGELHRRRDALLMEVARLERDHHRLAIRLTDVEGQFGGPMNARFVWFFSVENKFKKMKATRQRFTESIVRNTISKISKRSSYSCFANCKKILDRDSMRLP
jgi:hypothetical protein